MKTAFETAKAVSAGELTARQSVSAALAEIAKRDGQIDAFLEVFEKAALAQADAIDARKKEGKKLGRLAGVCVAIKDNMTYKGQLCTCGSKILAGHRAVYNSTVVERLLSEDAVIIGRANMDEFAMGSSSENSAYKVTKNPRDTSRVPGGSSSGSAAAVAAGMVPLSLGSDTGGSIRQPASLCGVVGLKPTYGLVSRYGLVAYASSLDQIGPFSADVRDSALILSVIAGHDSRDTTSAPAEKEDYLAALEGGIKGMKLGLPKEYFVEGMDEETSRLIRAGIEKLKKLGAEIVDISLPHTKYAMPAYYIIAPSEASSNLARFDGIRYGLSDKNAPTLKDTYSKSRGEGFGGEVKRRIMLGTYALSAGYYDAYYAKAQKIRTLIRRDFDRAFETVDAIVTPTSPTTAFKIGEKANDPVAMYLSDVCTIPCNMAGIPGLSVPCGDTASGLPVGIQFLGRPFGEKTLFKLGRAFETA